MRDDDDDDDRPRRKRRPEPDDADDEDRPRRRRPLDDADDEEPPARRRRPPENIEERRPRRRPMDDVEEDRPRRRRGRDFDDDDDDDRSRPRRRGRAPSSGLVTVVGIANFIFAALILMMAIALMVGGPTIMAMLAGTVQEALEKEGFPGGHPDAEKLRQQQEVVLRGVTAFGTAMFIMIGSCWVIFGVIPLGLAGLGVIQRREWGRILTLVLAGLNLLNAFWAFAGNWPILYAVLYCSINLGYSVLAFVVLLQPQFAEEFS